MLIGIIYFILSGSRSRRFHLRFQRVLVAMNDTPKLTFTLLLGTFGIFDIEYSCLSIFHTRRFRYFRYLAITLRLHIEVIATIVGLLNISVFRRH